MTAYVKVISHWFDKRRGLALGLTIAGFGFGVSMMPALAHTLISAADWKSAYFYLGIIVGVFTLPIVGLFLRGSPHQMGLMSDGKVSSDNEAQISVRTTKDLNISQARKTSTFWLMVIAFLLVSLAIHACIIHLVPIITDHGIDARTAALAASTLGVALIFARIGTGFLLDKFNAAFVGASIFAISACGLFLLFLTANVYVVFLQCF